VQDFRAELLASNALSAVVEACGQTALQRIEVRDDRDALRPSPRVAGVIVRAMFVRVDAAEY
jgi:hypothetical protein